MAPLLKRTTQVCYRTTPGNAYRLLAACFDLGWKNADDRRHCSVTVDLDDCRVTVLTIGPRHCTALVTASGSQAVALADATLLPNGAEVN
jgi:hypothetical protein